VTDTFDSLPSDLAAAHALILAERAARMESQARAARAEATLSYAQATGSSAEALIARLRLEIEKLRRALYGVRSERKERLLDQLEMQLEDVEADAIEDELTAERAASSTVVQSFERRRPARKPFPVRTAHLNGDLERHCGLRQPARWSWTNDNQHRLAA
jgi:transposase